MRYQIFGRRTGLRVSELSLGCGTFGTTWGYGAEPAEARRIFDSYVEAGGNFFDTADAYQSGESERLLGEFIAANRDDFVVATKYTMAIAPGAGISVTGNSRKNMVRAVEASLKRLNTDRIDLYWVHHADEVTPMDEIMRGLDDLVRAGKILYIGLSDFPAWRTAYAATLADMRGWAPLAGQQIEYSLVERTPERDLLPMAQAFGLGTVAWSPLGGGLLTGKYRSGDKDARSGSNLAALLHVENDARKTATLDALETVAEEIGFDPGQTAIAWVLAKGHIPILGPRTQAQLAGNLGAVNVTLSADQIQRLDDASAISLGFPHELKTRFAEVREGTMGGVPHLFDLSPIPVR
ncbi:oxidoreductase [Capsulimonas corticalis]|uniref:Oxidoreductase n=1 Tax=Capsulimonas corticalis TaxID=2219043 RepID=A0A402D398_9BACT|nr:aldo/keto reductase [Capsulimonas corticalis]BDI28510.1 oxidoreductase [Capsulimonas corticalis]